MRVLEGFGRVKQCTLLPLIPTVFRTWVVAKFSASHDEAVRYQNVVCLDCGREFSYDWLQMKILASKPYAARAAEPVTIVSGLKATFY